jgi:hypothetical protein
MKNIGLVKSTINEEIINPSETLLTTIILLSGMSCMIKG